MIDTATNALTATIGVGIQPYGVDFTPDSATETRKPVQLVLAGMKSIVLGEDCGLSPTPGPLDHMGPLILHVKFQPLFYFLCIVLADRQRGNIRFLVIPNQLRPSRPDSYPNRRLPDMMDKTKD